MHLRPFSIPMRKNLSGWLAIFLFIFIDAKPGVCESLFGDPFAPRRQGGLGLEPGSPGDDAHSSAGLYQRSLAVAAGRPEERSCAGRRVGVLQGAGVLAGKTYTSHPNSREELTAGTWVDQPVVRVGHLITSQAPGTAFAFALALVEALDSAETARKVAAGMLYRG